jgi:formylmethanofuran dehydrogenase subunit C
MGFEGGEGFREIDEGKDRMKNIEKNIEKRRNRYFEDLEPSAEQGFSDDEDNGWYFEDLEPSAEQGFSDDENQDSNGFDISQPTIEYTAFSDEIEEDENKKQDSTPSQKCLDKVKDVEEVEFDPVYKQLISLYKKFEIDDPAAIEENYNKAIELISNLNYSSEDITEFSRNLIQIQDDPDFEYKAGIFISALINKSNEDEFKIVTKGSKSMSYLGYKNTKKIVIDGDAGDMLGYKMSNQNSKITVLGNAGDSVGKEMNGGFIVVQGDAGDRIGEKMKNGSIIVIGDAGFVVGKEMENGFIRIDGSARRGVGYEMKGGQISITNKTPINFISTNCSGEIWYEYKLFIKNGKRAF